MRLMTPSLLSVHEIGHAVVAERLDKTVQQIGIDGEEGWTIAHWPDRNWDVDRFRAEAAIAYAGIAAEILFLLKAKEQEAAREVESDPLNANDQQLFLLAAMKTGGAPGQERKAAMIRARDVLNSHWSQLLSLATLLDERGQLSGDELRQGLARPTPQGANKAAG